MRHLLDNLEKDLQSPPAASIPSLGAEEERLPSDDVDDLLHNVFNEDRGQAEDVTPVNHDLDEEFLSDDEHLACAGGNPRNEELEQVDELGKIMAESLRVSETHQEVFEPEQTRGAISDDEF